MSKGLGIGVLAVGLLGLGWWAHGHNAHRIENLIRHQAEGAVEGSTHGVTTTVSGRDIHLSGIADSQDEADVLLAELMNLRGRRVVTHDLTILAPASPFALEVAKSETGLTASGNVPTEALRAELAGPMGDAAAGLTLASGAPEGWADLAKAGLAALAPMTKGAMSLVDGALKITGEVAGPDEAAALDAALAGLPEGSVTKDITLLDDGTPAAWTLDYSAATGAVAAGKLPKGLDLAAIASALGLSGIAGEVKTATLGEAADAGLFTTLKDWMGQIETLKYAKTETAQSLDIGVQGGVDGAAMQAALAGSLPDVAVAVSTVTVAGENGARRTNAATGTEERLMGGFWLAVPQIDLGLQGCQAAADGVLGASTINFVTGSDQLDGSALRVINDLSAIMLRCAEEAKLKAVIGGHTDNVGDAASNLGLSQRRATAVRREMIARGVPATALKSLGFGDTQPIADNGTDEGRAKNRRTTIQWSE